MEGKEEGILRPKIKEKLRGKCGEYVLEKESGRRDKVMASQIGAKVFCPPAGVHCNKGKIVVGTQKTSRSEYTGLKHIKKEHM